MSMAFVVSIWLSLLGTLALVSAESFRFCVHNDRELLECQRFSSVPPLHNPCRKGQCQHFECVKAEGSCREELIHKRADAMMASALGLYYMSREYPNTFRPILREVRGEDLDRSNTTVAEGLGYSAIAVVRTEACDATGSALTLANTATWRSCHGEYGGMAGWVAPVTHFLQTGLASGDNDVQIIKNFYSTSCAPANEGVELCSGCNSAEKCDLTDLYAGAVGVLECVAEAPDSNVVGFVDNWTALGSGQSPEFVEDEVGVNETTGPQEAQRTNQAEFMALCEAGCRGLDVAANDPSCHLLTLPSDVIVMREGDPMIDENRERMKSAASKWAFKHLFGTSGNVKGSFFSHGTSDLEYVNSTAEDYIGTTLYIAMQEYENVFTLTPQGDAALVKEVKDNPVGAIAASGVLFGLLGVALGMCCMLLLCRYRNQRRSLQRETSLSKDPTGMPAMPVMDTRADVQRGEGGSMDQHMLDPS